MSLENTGINNWPTPDYNLACFNIMLEAIEPTATAAQASLNKKINNLNIAINAIRNQLKLKFIEGSIKSVKNFTHLNELENGPFKLKEYKAIYHYSFQINEMDKLGKVYEILSKFPDIKVSAKPFNSGALPVLEKKVLDNKLNRDVLQTALNKLPIKFYSKCKELGLNPNDFDVYGYEIIINDNFKMKNNSFFNLKNFGGVEISKGRVIFRSSLSTNHDSLKLSVSEPIDNLCLCRCWYQKSNKLALNVVSFNDLIN